MLTPYQFASNSPIGAIDLDGLEHQEVKDILDKIDPALGNHVIIHVGPQVYPEGAVPSPIITHVQQVHKQVLAPSNRGGLSDSPQIYIPFQEPDLSYQDQFTPLWQKWFSNKADINLSNSNLALATIFGPTIIDKFWKAGKFTLQFLKHRGVIKNAIQGASKFTRKVPSSGFLDKDRAVTFTKKFKAIKENISKLNGDTLQGAIKDLHKDISAVHPPPWNNNMSNGQHFNKIDNAMRGVANQIEWFKKELNSGNLFGEASKGAAAAIQAGEKALLHAKKVIKAAKESAANY